VALGSAAVCYTLSTVGSASKAQVYDDRKPMPTLCLPVPVRYWSSPHFSPGRRCPVDMVVIHAISLPPGVFATGHIVELFMGKLDARAHPSFAELKGLRVSAHFLIERDGSINQFVDTEDTAWHAGVSEFQGRQGCNDFSVGVELEGDQQTPFAEPQYQALELLLRALMETYPAITPDRVVGHSHVAPGRKWDPGPKFDWGRLARMLRRIRPATREGI